MKTREKTIKEVELTQKDLITAIKNYVEKEVKLSGVVTITCRTENGGQINLLPVNTEEGEEIVTYIEIHEAPPQLDILKSPVP